MRNLGQLQTNALLLAVLLGLGSCLSASTATASQSLSLHGLAESPAAWRQARFESVVRELAMAVAPTPAWSVRSLSSLEFEVSTSVRLGFVNANPDVGEMSSAWDQAVEADEASPVIPVARAWFRKGLPWSFELGGNFGWHAGAQAFVIGGYGRWVLLDRWPKLPDVSIQLGYDGYIGNPSLELGVLSTALSVGGSFKIDRGKGKLPMYFSPFGGYVLLISHAQANRAELAELMPISGFLEEVEAGVNPLLFHHHRAFGGIEVRPGQFLFRFSGEVTIPRTGLPVAGLSVGLGVRF